MFKSINIDKEWVKKVGFTEFKKNSVISTLEPMEQVKLYEELTGKKVKIKGE